MEKEEMGFIMRRSCKYCGARVNEKGFCPRGCDVAVLEDVIYKIQQELKQNEDGRLSKELIQKIMETSAQPIRDRSGEWLEELVEKTSRDLRGEDIIFGASPR